MYIMYKLHIEKPGRHGKCVRRHKEVDCSCQGMGSPKEQGVVLVRDGERRGHCMKDYNGTTLR